jgi:hypothetical protein
MLKLQDETLVIELVPGDDGGLGPEIKRLLLGDFVIVWHSGVRV